MPFSPLSSLFGFTKTAAAHAHGTWTSESSVHSKEGEGKRGGTRQKAAGNSPQSVLHIRDNTIQGFGTGHTLHGQKSQKNRYLLSC